jgi:chromosomal replication initiation ATPase DnaA
MPAPDRLFAVAKQIPLATIDRAVCARLGPARVTGNAQPAVFNRQVAMYLAKHVGGWSTTKIGKFYHGRDHSTVCHAIRRIESMREDNPKLDAVLSALGREI